MLQITISMKPQPPCNGSDTSTVIRAFDRVAKIQFRWNTHEIVSTRKKHIQSLAKIIAHFIFNSIRNELYRRNKNSRGTKIDEIDNKISQSYKTFEQWKNEKEKKKKKNFEKLA